MLLFFSCAVAADLLSETETLPWRTALELADQTLADVRQRPAAQVDPSYQEWLAARGELQKVQAQLIVIEAALTEQQLLWSDQRRMEASSLHALSVLRDATTATRAQLLAVLDATRLGAPAPLQRAVDAWWSERERVDWAAIDAGERDLSALKAAEEGMLQVEAQAGTALVQPLIAVAEQDEQAMRDLRRAERDAQTRTPWAYEKLQNLEREQRDLRLQLPILQARMEQLQPASAVDGQRSVDQARVLAAVYDQLLERVELEETEISRESWCRLWVHGGEAHLYAGQMESQLRLANAAAAWNGACSTVAFTQTQSPTFLAAWSAATLQAARAGASTVLMDTNLGDWRIDGMAVHGVGASYVTLTPGVHRIELVWPSGQRAFVVEQLEADAQYALTPQANRIHLDAIDIYAPQEVTTELPSPILPLEEDDLAVIARPFEGRGQLGLYGLWTQFDGLDHMGLSLQVGVPIAQVGKTNLRLHVQQDIARGVHGFRYSDTWTMPLLLRTWGSMSAQVDTATLSPGLMVSGGALLPTGAGLIRGGAFVDYAVPESRLVLQLTTTLGTSIWSEGLASLEPGVQLGLIYPL